LSDGRGDRKELDNFRVSAVIPTRGRVDSLLRTLDSIRLQSGVGVIELIVVDDASEPPLKLDTADVAVIRFDSSRGACAARNAGTDLAQGDFLLFMDDDAELVEPSEVLRALRWFVDHPRLAVVGFRQLTPNGDVHHAQPISSEVPAHTNLFYSYGCLVDRKAYRDVGGMNEMFGYYYEEVELSLKLFAAGFGIIYDPTLRVIHHQDVRNRDARQIQRRTTRNACLSYLLHYPAVLLPILFLKRVFLHARLCGRRFPSPSDIRWVMRELISLRHYVWKHRNPYRWRIVREFHRGCGRAIPWNRENGARN
jgi:GT2 family glycosyltransferase